MVYHFAEEILAHLSATGVKAHRGEAVKAFILWRTHHVVPSQNEENKTISSFVGGCHQHWIALVKVIQLDLFSFGAAGIQEP